MLFTFISMKPVVFNRAIMINNVYNLDVKFDVVWSKQYTVQRNATMLPSYKKDCRKYNHLVRPTSATYAESIVDIVYTVDYSTVPQSCRNGWEGLRARIHDPWKKLLVIFGKQKDSRYK